MNNDTAMKTGESIYRRTSYSLNEITFDGNKGVFFERDINDKKDEKSGKYPRTQLTEESEAFPVVFLKIRRFLASFSKTEGFKRTNEHNTKDEEVTLYTKSGSEVGIAREIREKYKDLRTQQVIYCYLPNTEDKIVRVIVKGSSLGSSAEHEQEVLKFYDYLQSFEGDEHSHQYVTNLVPIHEDSPLGGYYAISFERGEKLNKKELGKVMDMIDVVYEKTTAIDVQNQKTASKPSTAEETQEGGDNAPEADFSGGKVVPDEEEIDVNSIPF